MTSTDADAATTNADAATIVGFGEEWAAFDQSVLDETELNRRFEEYFGIFPLERLDEAEGFDLGCGSGRWDGLLAERVRVLHCIDPAPKALEVARRTLAGHSNITFHVANCDAIPFPDDSQQFGVSLGVLHHTPDPTAALRSAVRKLKPGAPFLLYLYYNFENRPPWFYAIWKATDFVRRVISRLPFRAKRAVCDLIAAVIYYPLARGSLLLEKVGANVTTIPLAPYRSWSFYSMRTDALDRFGTRIEHRFSREQIACMMNEAGLDEVRFSEHVPHWVACGTKI